MHHFLAEKLFNYKVHESQIVKIHEKCRSHGKRFQVGGEFVELSQIAVDSTRFAKALAKDLKEGNYKISPALLKPIIIKGKERILFKFNLTDTILHGAVSQILNDHCLEIFSKNLHSYIRGRNYWKAIQQFAKFCSGHFNQNIPPHKKGLFILRRDIASYTDSIPVHEESPLWNILKIETAFPEKPNSHEKRAWDYLTSVIRAEVKNSQKGPSFIQNKGVPTGSPISTTLFNLYMIELDKEIDKINPGFYARYGDDLIVADQDIQKTRKIDILFKEILKKYHLKSKEEKENSIYLTIPGKHPDPVLAPEYRGCDRVTFLGCDIMAKGPIAISRKLEKEIIKETRTRLAQCKQLHPNIPDIKQKLTLYCKTINQMFEPDNRLAHKSAGLLKYAITDRSCLKRLDYSIARAILHAVTKDKSIKKFRQISIKDMRNCGLGSLVNNRNQVGKERNVIKKERK
jgi:hypothetical protein